MNNTAQTDDLFESRYFNPRNDVAFKKIFFNHPEMTMSFLNSTLRLDGDREIVKIEFLPTERLPMIAESKKSILDVLCTDQIGHQYIIEVQNKYMLNYLQRVQYYASHLYAGQLKVGDNYLKLKDVTLLSLLNHVIFPDDVNYLSFHHNIEKETQTSYLNNISYAFIELPKFNKKLEDLETPEDYWIFMMKEAAYDSQVPNSAPEEVKQAYDMLEKYKWTRLEHLAYEQARIGLMDDFEIMRSAEIKGMEKGMEKGMKKGMKKGIEKGIEQGIEQGIERGKIEVARQLIIDGMSLEKICGMTGLGLDIVRGLEE